MGKSRKPQKPKGNRGNILKNTYRIRNNERILSKLKNETINSDKNS